MCYSELVNAAKTSPFAGGQSDGYLRSVFNSFTFAGNNDENVDIVSFLTLGPDLTVLTRRSAAFNSARSTSTETNLTLPVLVTVNAQPTI